MRIFCILSLAVLLGLSAAGCGSTSPITDDYASDGQGMTRDDIKPRVDAATEDLDRVIDEVDTRSNAPLD
jgi:hypothetical protein